VADGGHMYFVVEGREPRIMSFDLNNENFTYVRPLPNMLSTRGSWGLTEVRGRLGIAYTHDSPTLAKTEVWVMEGMAGQRKWNCWYILQVNKGYWLWHKFQHLSQPHFAHTDKHVLTQDQDNALFGHIPKVDDTRKARHGVVETTKNNRGRPYNIEYNYKVMSTFVYVETREPLSVYKCW
jgi:hypothetical protein